MGKLPLHDKVLMYLLPDPRNLLCFRIMRPSPVSRMWMTFWDNYVSKLEAMSLDPDSLGVPLMVLRYEDLCLHLDAVGSRPSREGGGRGWKTHLPRSWFRMPFHGRAVYCLQKESQPQHAHTLTHTQSRPHLPLLSLLAGCRLCPDCCDFWAPP